LKQTIEPKARGNKKISEGATTEWAIHFIAYEIIKLDNVFHVNKKAGSTQTTKGRAESQSSKNIETNNKTKSKKKSR